MAEVQAKVTSVDGDHALITIPGGGCGRCHEPGGCGGHNLTQIFCVSPKAHRVLNPANAKVGESVVVIVSERTFLRSALIGYGLPLSGLFAGACLGLVVAGDFGSMLGGVCGLFVAWAVQRLPAIASLAVGGDSLPRIK